MGVYVDSAVGAAVLVGLAEVALTEGFTVGALEGIELDGDNDGRTLGFSVVGN